MVNKIYNIRIEFIKRFKSIKGIGLIELIFAVALFSMILILIYNIFFISQKSYNSIKNQTLVTLDLQEVLEQLNSEVKKARKATEKEDSILLVSSTELRLYTDIEGDDRPELLRYRIDENNLLKSCAIANNDSYPYTYTSFHKEAILLRDIVNTDVFSELAPVNPDNPKDHRRKVKLRLVIENQNKMGEPYEIINYLMTRSRVEVE